MSPRPREVRTLLEMFPISILRRIIEEREIQFKSRKSDELIDRLMEVVWSDQEYEELKERLARIEREKQPHGRYIADLSGVHQGLEDSPAVDRVEELLLTRECYFDDDDELVEEGFLVKEKSDSVISGIHWTESINYTLTPMNDVEKTQKLYESEFWIHLDEGLVFIDCSLPAKATNLLKEFDELGIETADVGHENLTNTLANEYVQKFVDDFKEKVEAEASQSRLSKSASQQPLKIDLVNILLDDAELKDVKIGGRTDIFKNEEVSRFQNEHDSRIVRLEGEFKLEEKWFNFTVGYSDGMGIISVEKKGRVEERPEAVQAAYDFLYDEYEKYFVDVP